MCSYSTSTGTKEVQETDESGNVTTVTKTVLSVNVTLKYYRDMISIYSFDSNQTELIGQMMSSEFMGQPGIGGNRGVDEVKQEAAYKETAKVREDKTR